MVYGAIKNRPENNKKGKELKKIFDYRFPHLVQSGELDRLFAKWNW
jgi:polar amino acid transport system substrate-binding protein